MSGSNICDINPESELPQNISSDEGESDWEDSEQVLLNRKRRAEQSALQPDAKRRRITISNQFEEESGVKFTINFLKLWNLDQYIDLFIKEGIDKASFLHLTERSKIFQKICHDKDVKKILHKKKTLLEYLAEPSYKKEGINGTTLTSFLINDLERKKWIKLDDTQEIGKKICNFILDNILLTQMRRSSIKPYEFRFWALEICSVWPNHNDVWVWYKPYIFNGSSKKIQGKLYEIYKHNKEYTRKISNKIKTKETAVLKEIEMKEDLKISEELSTLYSSSTIDKEFLRVWTNSLEYRRKKKLSINVLANNSVIFENVDNVKQLLHEDFTKITEKTIETNHLDNVWQELTDFIIYFDTFSSKSMQRFRNKFSSMKDRTAEMEKDMAWRLLPHYMPPTANCSGNKERFKSSKKEGADAFIQFIQDRNKLAEKIIETRQKMENLNERMCPYIIAVENEFKISRVYVIVCEKRYECETITEAVDLALKFHIVEGYKYSKLSRCTWSFIERYLYDININPEQYDTVNRFIQQLEIKRTQQFDDSTTI